MAKHGLGRGFESLIPTELTDEGFDPTQDEVTAVGTLREIKLEQLERDPDQPRKNFDPDALNELAESIKEHGVLSPIVVVKSGSKYRIVAGERRWRAAKIVGLKTIPSIVRTANAQSRLEMSIIENAQREDLNAIELATAYSRLKNEFNLSNEDIAKKVGKAETTIVNTLRFLKLPEKAKKVMLENNVPDSLMRPLISAPDEVVDKLLPRIAKGEMTLRQIEHYVSQSKQKSSYKAMKMRTHIKQEERISKKYGAKVKINTLSITLSCKTEKELLELLKKI